MLSLTLTKVLVYSALALSLICALGTILAVVWETARVRRPRWRWAMAAPIAACLPAAWVWLYPGFVIGAIIGGELGAELGRHLPPSVDATLMALGIALGTYVVFVAPLAALAVLVGLAVTTPSPTIATGAASDEAAPSPPGKARMTGFRLGARLSRAAR